MKRKILIILLPLFLLACKTLLPGTSPTRHNPVTVPIPTIPNTSTPRPTVEAIMPAPTGTGFTLTRLHPQDGDLPALLAAEVKKAATLGQLPVVEFDATWCPPCQAIDSSLEEKNELMLAAFDGVYIIRLDVDEWDWNMKQYGFDFEGIPVYFKLDAQGKPNGEVIDGNAWGENIPENMAPPLDKFFHGQ